MKRLTQIFPLLLAVLLQVLPLLRNIVTAPTATSTFAIVLRWTLGSSAALGAFDACSGATNYFATPSNLVATVGMPFTTNLTLQRTGSDSGAATTIISNSVSVTLFANGTTSTFAMPQGLTLKFVDNGTANGVFDVISGTPTKVGTNVFRVDMSFPGQTTVSGTYNIVVLPGGSSPTITNHPASVTTNVGNFVTFSVTNGGTAPFKYQWFFNTNTPLVNYTNSTLAITNVQLTHAGTYSVAITNSIGSTNSTFAWLTVWQPPAITNQPADFTNVAGGVATFSVTAGGVPPPAYQWKWNGSTVLANATNASLSLTNLRASQTGTYSVTITNAGGTTNTILATLAITNPSPTALTSPTNGGGVFWFTFIPTVGLTNSVQTNSVPDGGTWVVLTNVPPPATADPITVTDALGSSNRFYRVQVIP